MREEILKNLVNANVTLINDTQFILCRCLKLPRTLILKPKWEEKVNGG